MATLESLKATAIETLEWDETFVKAVESLDDLFGFADEWRLHKMCEIDEAYYGMSATEILRDLTSDFNINDDYFYHDIYGLESISQDKASWYREHTNEKEVLKNLIKRYKDLDLEWISGELNYYIGLIVNGDYED